jgi:membrane associated rhomboid family serine protease
MRRTPSPYASTISFGPGPVSPAIKALIATNVVVFLAQSFAPRAASFGPDVLTAFLGLRAADVLGHLYIWQLATYMFLHASVLHILFNMLGLWMFGAELERIWGTRYFLKYYFVTGIGAAILTVIFSLLPFGFAEALRYSIVIGASGAIYGILLAYGLHFPDRPIYMYLVFPIPAKYFVMIMGALAFYSSVSGGSGVASATHLGGLVIGYLFLKRARIHPLSELKYRYTKWKLSRTRKRFDVYSGGRANDWNRRVH